MKKVLLVLLTMMMLTGCSGSNKDVKANQMVNDAASVVLEEHNFLSVQNANIINDQKSDKEYNVALELRSTSKYAEYTSVVELTYHYKNFKWVLEEAEKVDESYKLNKYCDEAALEQYLDEQYKDFKLVSYETNKNGMKVKGEKENKLTSKMLTLTLEYDARKDEFVEKESKTQTMYW